MVFLLGYVVGMIVTFLVIMFMDGRKDKNN